MNDDESEEDIILYNITNELNQLKTTIQEKKDEISECNITLENLTLLGTLYYITLHYTTLHYTT